MSILVLLRPAPPPPRVVLVGGVPGAGKSTALAQLARDVPEASVLDPDQIRAVLRRVLPDRVPQRAYRPLVHALHALRVVGALFRGPDRRRALLVHDPATRPRRRWMFARLARRYGWDPALVFIDVSRSGAEQGQADRGRLVNPRSFGAHWLRWQDLRSDLTATSAGLDAGLWSEVVLTDRSQVVSVLHRYARVPHNHTPVQTPVASGSRNSSR